MIRQNRTGFIALRRASLLVILDGLVTLNRKGSWIDPRLRLHFLMDAEPFIRVFKFLLKHCQVSFLFLFHLLDELLLSFGQDVELKTRPKKLAKMVALVDERHEIGPRWARLWWHLRSLAWIEVLVLILLALLDFSLNSASVYVFALDRPFWLKSVCLR